MISVQRGGVVWRGFGKPHRERGLVCPLPVVVVCEGTSLWMQPDPVAADDSSDEVWPDALLYCGMTPNPHSLIILPLTPDL